MAFLRFFFFVFLALVSFRCPCFAVDQPQVEPSHLLLYPSSDLLFSKHVYGDSQAAHHVTIMLFPSNGSDRRLFLALYPELNPLIASGKVQLELKLFVMRPFDRSIFLAASCVEPEQLPAFLTALFQYYSTLIEESPFDIDESLALTLAENVQFAPPSLDKSHFFRRAEWCLSQTKAGMLYSEADRLNSTYRWALDGRIGKMEAAVVVDQQVFDRKTPLSTIMGTLH